MSIREDFSAKFAADFSDDEKETVAELNYLPLYNWKYGYSPNTDEAILFLCAHLIYISRKQTPTYPREQESEGGFSVTHLIDTKGSQNYYATTSYGQRFLMLKKSIRGGGAAFVP